MNTLDLIIIVLLFLNFFNGFRQGLIKALANLIGWFLALVVALRYSQLVQPWMQAFSPDPVLQKIAAFMLVVMAVLLLTWFVGLVLHNIFKQLKLSWLNRIAGSAFGLGKSLLVVLVLLYALGPWFSESKLWQNSVMIQLLMPYTHDSMQLSKKVMQKTSEALQYSERKDHNPAQDAIIPEASTEGTQHQVENPFL